MSTYSVAQVETLSGIKAHTLRVWERRYSFLKPSRTSTNIRFYSDDQMKKLLNIGILIRNGYRISQVDSMTDNEINGIVTEIITQPADNKYIDQIHTLALSMLEMDEETFNKVFQKQVVQEGLLNTMLNVIYPFLKHVGVLWRTSKTIPSQEHFVSNLIRQKIISAINDISHDSKNTGKKIVLFLPENEQHEIGLLLASYIAKDLGWKEYYLGQNVPYTNISEIATITKCDLLMTISVISQKNDLIKMVEKVIETTSVPLLISGHQVDNSFDKGTDQIIPIRDPFELIKFLKAY